MIDPRIALHLFDWLDSRLQDNEPALPEPQILDEAITYPCSNSRLLEAVVAQPLTSHILEEFRSLFENRGKVQERDCIQFLRQIRGAVQGADSVLDYRYTGSVLHMIKGQYNDSITYRPGVKRGWCLHLTACGGGVYNGLRSSLVAERGDLVMFSPDACYNYKRADDHSRWEHHWIVFQPSPRQLEWMCWPSIGSGISHLRCDDHQLERVEAIFREIAVLSAWEDSDFIQLREHLFEEVLLRCLPQVPSIHRQGPDVRVKKAMTYIKENLGLEINLNEVALYANMSISSLTRLFKKYTGLSVLEWRDEQRMMEACDKLAHSSLSIGQIANSLGFSDQLYFSRCFKRNVGMPPRNYRKQFGGTRGSPMIG